uniref:ATP synthase complex subunit 8 n=1 Tax=Megalothorax incertus TaxID=2579793 RepID=A0A8E8L9U3_9HEXA|nr:ATP synthase F0 subunit 8 [Megalothorax incertus]
MPQMGPLMWFILLSSSFLVLWTIISKQIFNLKMSSPGSSALKPRLSASKWMWW